MKLMKEIKKLKFWSRKKRKKKDDYHYHKLPQYSFEPSYYHPPPPPLRPAPPLPPPPPPPPLEGCQCHFCQPAEPSAPPLHPWLESEQVGYSTWIDPFPGPSKGPEEGDHCVRISQEIVFRTATTSTAGAAATTSAAAAAATDVDTVASSSGQLEGNTEIRDASNSALQQYSPRKEKAAAGGLFGCVVDVGALLFRCFFPCVRISECHLNHYNPIVSDKALAHQNLEKKIH